MQSPSAAFAPLPEAGTVPSPVLEGFVAAGLVSHEMIADPDRFAGEVAALAALCRHVAGPVYRFGAFHYGFRPAPADLGGLVAALAPAAWAAAIEAAIAADLAADLEAEPSGDDLPGTGGAAGPAAWVNALDHFATTALDTHEILFLASGGAAAAETLAARPDLAAVIHAGAAAKAAAAAATLVAAVVAETRAEVRAEAGLEASGLVRALDVFAARLGSVEIALRPRPVAGLAAAPHAAAVDHVPHAAASDHSPRAVGGRDAALAARLDAQAALLAEQAARQEALASGMAGLQTALAGFGGAVAGLERRIGLTLAEFLARLEAGAALAEMAPAPAVLAEGPAPASTPVPVPTPVRPRAGAAATALRARRG